MWYQIVSALVNVGLAWQDQYLSNRINKTMYRTAAKTAEINAKMEYANFARRTQYRNEELGQQVWDIAQQGRELAGVQNTSMAASGFDVSTGDQRILTDTLQRNLDKISGVNRTYYLQQFEDELKTTNDIIQYNFEAYANRQMVQNYSGLKGFAKIVDAGGRAFVNSASSNLFANSKGGISSNTGAGTSFPSKDASSYGSFLNSKNKSSLGSFGNFGSMNF